MSTNVSRTVLDRRSLLSATGLGALGASAAPMMAACAPDEDTNGAAAGSELACNSIYVAEIRNTINPQAQREWQREKARTFEEATGVAVQYETMPSYDDQYTQIQTSAITGNGPDIFVSGTTWVPVAASTGAFHIMGTEDWEAIGGRDRFFDESLAISGKDQQTEVGIPYVQRPFSLVYNTRMFDEAGFSGPPETWDELIEMSHTITTEGVAEYGTAIPYSDTGNWKWIWMFALQYGGRIISEDRTTALLDSNEVVHATEAFFNLVVENDGVNPRSATMEGPDVQAMMANEEIAMAAMATPNWTPGLDAGSVAGNYAFAPHPVIPPGYDSMPDGGVPAGSIVSGDALLVPEYSECKAAVFQFIEFLTNEESQLEYFQKFGSLPANEDAGQTLADDDPTVAPLIDAVGEQRPTPFVGAWSEAQLGLSNVPQQSLNDLANGTYDGESIRQLLDEANRQVQESLDRQQEHERSQ